MQIEYKEVFFPLTVFALGSCQTKDTPPKTIFHEFIEHCQSSTLVINGPSIFGHEVLPYSQQAYAILIEALQTEALNNTPLTLNFVGFSRGGIILLHIANFLQEHLKKLSQIPTLSKTDAHIFKQLNRVEINLCNLDPVAGLGSKNLPFARQIPKIIKKYIAILQVDEMRREFKPQDLSRIIVESSQTTEIIFLPIYGNHSDATRIKSADKTSAYTLFQGLLYHFLNLHHIKFSLVPTIQTPLDMLKWFSLHHQERQKYLEYGKRMKFFDSMMLRKPRKLQNNLQYYIEEQDIFINQCEKELLKYCFPNLFHRLFEQNIHGCEQMNVLDDIQNVQRQIPELWRRLNMHFANIEHCISGKAHLTPLQILPHLYVDISAEYKHSTDFRRYQLRHDVTLLTLRYEREKSEYLPFHQQPLAKASRLLRETLYPKHNTEELDYQEIIKRLQSISKAYKLAQHENQLQILIDDLLKKYDEEVPLVQPYRTWSILGIQLLCNSLYYFIDLVGHLGYIGGLILSAMGQFLIDFSNRLSDVSHHSSIFWLMIVLLYGTGELLFSHFGIKPLAEYLKYELMVLRDNWIKEIVEDALLTSASSTSNYKANKSFSLSASS